MLPVALERRRERRDGGRAAQGHRVVGLHEEPAPGEVRRAAQHGLRLLTVDHDRLVVLQVAHVLALDVVATRAQHEPPLGLRLGRLLFPVLVGVVDDHPQPAPELLEPGHDAGLVEVVRDDANARGAVGDRLIEDLQDGAPRLEAHPRQRLGDLRMGRGERQTRVAVGRQQRRDRPELVEPVDERLRRDEPPREGDVELPRVRLTAQLDRHVLRFADAQLVVVVHEDGRHPVDELAFELGVAGEVHPAELLDGRSASSQAKPGRRGRRRERTPGGSSTRRTCRRPARGTRSKSRRSRPAAGRPSSPSRAAPSPRHGGPSA